MITRREIMASGIAVTLLARASAAAAVSTAGADAQPQRRVFVAEAGIPDAVAATRTATGPGVVPLSFESDVTRVYEWLDVELRTARVLVGGLTTPQALFAIERLAWDRGLRTAYRGLHRRVGGPAPSHELLGSPAIVERIESIDPHEWAEGLGRALTVAVPGPADYRHVVTSQQVPRIDDNAFVSWLLAPREMMSRRLA